jgi:bifunctional DNase/RNase
MVEVCVETVTKDATQNMVVVLKEKQGGRTLPISVGPHEAQAILAELRGIKPLRPQTHDLMRHIVEHLEARLARVVLEDLRENIYYASLFLARNGREEQVDARPSDAIALALRTGAPIFVADKVMKDASWELPAEPADQPN